MKTCHKCDKDLPDFMFGKRATAYDGLSDTCRICTPKPKSQYKPGTKMTEGQKLASKRRNNYQRKILSDRYVSRVLVMRGFSRADIERYPELIEIKRLEIKTKRRFKQIVNDNEGN